MGQTNVSLPLPVREPSPSFIPLNWTAGLHSILLYISATSLCRSWKLTSRCPCSRSGSERIKPFFYASLLIDCLTNFFCTWTFICGVPKLKDHSREICYLSSRLQQIGQWENQALLLTTVTTFTDNRSIKNICQLMSKATIALRLNYTIAHNMHTCVDRGRL